jgi:hypothetical protein
MKKIAISLSILFIGLGSIYAQPNLTATSVFDDFSTANEYNDPTTGRGIYWWGQTGVNTVTRDATKGELTVHATQAVYQYVPFGVSFGDDNGALPGGVPYTIDLSSDGTWSFDITNYGTESLFLRVACVDNEDTIVDCNPIPTPAGVAFDQLRVWAYQVQILIPAGSTVTFEAGTPNGAGGGELNNCDFANGVWGDWGVWNATTQTHIGAGVRRRCDLTKIKGISFTPINSAKNTVDQHALALVNGYFGISNFKVGSSTAPLGIDESLVQYNFLFYPNPAKSSLTLVNNSVDTPKSVEIFNTIGSLVYSNNKPFTNNNELLIDTNGLNPGMYIVKIGMTSKKLIIE